jgi:anaerobic magnesium-protoporphyrin IX monomethyl ester cyclase
MNEIVFPVGLVYLASSIKGHTVHLFDPNGHNDPQKAAAEIVGSIKPDLVGISLRNIEFFTFYDRLGDKISFINDLAIFLKKIKEICPAAKIVTGGSGFTIFAMELMSRFTEIDAGISGEGEISFNEYLKNMNTPEKVKGLYWRSADRILFTGKPKPFDLDALEFPQDIDRLDMNHYRRPYAIGVQSKRGCAFGCTYCTYPFLEGTHIRMRSPMKVVDEIENLNRRYNINHFAFVDSVFNVPLHHASNICREIIKRELNINLSANFRPDHMSDLFFQEIRRAGFKVINYSIDALSRNGLASLAKKLSIKTIMASCKPVQKSDVVINFSVFPDLSCYDIFSTIETGLNLVRIKAMLGSRGRVSFSRIRIYPQTPIHRSALAKKMIDHDDDLLFPAFWKSPAIGRLFHELVGLYLKLSRKNRPDR